MLKKNFKRFIYFRIKYLSRKFFKKIKYQLISNFTCQAKAKHLKIFVKPKGGATDRPKSEKIDGSISEKTVNNT